MMEKKQTQKKEKASEKTEKNDIEVFLRSEAKELQVSPEELKLDVEEQANLVFSQSKNKIEKEISEKNIKLEKYIPARDKHILIFRKRTRYDIEKEFFRPVKKKSIFQRFKLKRYLEKAGIETKEESVKRKINHAGLLFNSVISFFLIIFFFWLGYNSLYVLYLFVLFWIFLAPFFMFSVWLLYLIYLDFKIYKRKVQLEKVLPDFLQLAANNMKAGLPIDKALWFAVKPRFGVLSKEIELVAKETLIGEELTNALQNFANKYDSPLLNRSINLLVEGIKAGGNISELFEKIALDIQQTNILKKEMAANVINYAIFITMAALFMAPVLFALSHTLLQVVQTLVPKVQTSFVAASGFPFRLFYTTMTLSNFQIFTLVYLLLTSCFSAMIISIIRKGDIKEGISYIPIFMIISLIVYFISSFLLSRLVAGVI